MAVEPVKLTAENLKKIFSDAIGPLRRDLYVPPDVFGAVVEDGIGIDDHDKALLRDPRTRVEQELTKLHVFQGGLHDHTAEVRENNPVPKDFDVFIDEMKNRLIPPPETNRKVVKSVEALLACPLLKGASEDWAVGGNVMCTAKMSPNQVRDLLRAGDKGDLLELFNRKFEELKGAPRGEEPKIKRLRELLKYTIEARDEVPADNVILVHEAEAHVRMLRAAATQASRNASDMMKAIEEAEAAARGELGARPVDPARRVAAEAAVAALNEGDRRTFQALEDARAHVKRLNDLYEHSFLNGFNPFNGTIAKMQAACRWMPLSQNDGTSVNTEIEKTVLKELCPNLFKGDGTKKDGLTDVMMPHKFCMRCGCLTGVTAFFKLGDIRGAGKDPATDAAKGLDELRRARADDYDRVLRELDPINHWHLVPHEGTLRPADQYEYCGGRTNALVKIYIMRVFIKTLYDNSSVYDITTTNPILRGLIMGCLKFISKADTEETVELRRIIDTGLFQSDRARNNAHRLNNDDTVRVATIYKPGPHLFPALEWNELDYPVGSIPYPMPPVFSLKETRQMFQNAKMEVKTIWNREPGDELMGTSIDYMFGKLKGTPVPNTILFFGKGAGVGIKTHTMPSIDEAYESVINNFTQRYYDILKAFRVEVTEDEYSRLQAKYKRRMNIVREVAKHTDFSIGALSPLHNNDELKVYNGRTKPTNVHTRMRTLLKNSNSPDFKQTTALHRSNYANLQKALRQRNMEFKRNMAIETQPVLIIVSDDAGDDAYDAVMAKSGNVLHANAAAALVAGEQAFFAAAGIVFGSNGNVAMGDDGFFNKAMLSYRNAYFRNGGLKAGGLLDELTKRFTTNQGGAFKNFMVRETFEDMITATREKALEIATTNPRRSRTLKYDVEDAVIIVNEKLASINQGVLFENPRVSRYSELKVNIEILRRALAATGAVRPLYYAVPAAPAAPAPANEPRGAPGGPPANRVRRRGGSRKKRHTIRKKKTMKMRKFRKI